MNRRQVLEPDEVRLEKPYRPRSENLSICMSQKFERKKQLSCSFEV